MKPEETTYVTVNMKDSTLAYLLWLLGLIGFCGIHRFYVEKPITGLIWLFTGGLCFIGQFIDLIYIPSMVDEVNLEKKELMDD